MNSKMAPDKASRQEIIKNFMPVVHYWARHYYFQCHQVLELEDLITVGVIGLIDALNKFKKDKKAQFKTYAEFRIRGEIIDELRKQDWMSRSERTKQKKFKKAKAGLTQDLGRNPTTAELSNVVELKTQDLVRMAQYESGDTIKEYIDGETPTLESTPNEFDIYALKKTLSVVMDELSRTMRLIVMLKYYEDLNFAEIANLVNLSEGRVCQLHGEALEFLKNHIESQKIDILAA